ncbi:MAG: imidazole glycerol phosphate synthase subunit HisH [Candidatus Woesearchaeota archaeon]
MNDSVIKIIDYGMGNLRSVQKALDRIGVKADICNDYKNLKYADKIILPGVGHFKKGIENLISMGFFDELNELVLIKKKPILGICLGMQLMTSYSEEGDCEGFGWIDAITTKFKFEDNNLKIPHMGWNNLNIRKNDNILSGITEHDFFYFVHSYNINCKNNEDVVATTYYGKDFVSVFNKENIFGCQFHPEKSHDTGLKILKNFAAL